MESLPLVEAAFAVVSGEESHRNATFVWTAKLPTTAFVAKSFENMRRCFKLVGNPADYVKKNFNANTRLVSSNNSFADVHSNNAFSSNDTTNKSHVSTSNEQLFRLMSLLNDIGVFTANANMPCENQHMAIHAKFLINIMDISNLGLTVCHPNGTQDLITKIGFKENRIMGIGNQCNGLYLFEINNACKIVSNSCIASSHVSKSLRHQRLGHHVDQVLDVLKSAPNLDSHLGSDHLCDTCNKAKQTREAFPLSLHKLTKIGQLVYLDVWFYKIVSRDGFRYFLTVVDDFMVCV
ncbi:ribonuclease H-like domain-containing protein [Tanacetum coccineum]